MTITQERSSAEIDALTDGEAVARAEHLSKVYGTGGVERGGLWRGDLHLGRAGVHHLHRRRFQAECS